MFIKPPIQFHGYLKTLKYFLTEADDAIAFMTCGYRTIQFGPYMEGLTNNIVPMQSPNQESETVESEATNLPPTLAPDVPEAGQGLPRRALTVDAFSLAFGICRTVVFELLAAGELPAKKCGRRTLIRADDIEVWLAALPASAASIHATITPGWGSRRMISVAEFSFAYAIGRTKAFSLIGKGELPSKTCGRSRLILVDDAEAWLVALPAWRSQVRGSYRISTTLPSSADQFGTPTLSSHSGLPLVTSLAGRNTETAINVKNS